MSVKNAESPLHVVAAVIYSPDQSEILLALRPEHLHQGGLWEFPGGKLETGEAAEQALIRELQEEIAITPIRYQPLLRVEHDYGDKQVLLDVWSVTAFTGCPEGLENQRLEWVKREHVDNYAFPAANRRIVEAVTKS